MSMEFSIPNKAKKVTLLLIITGSVFTLLGIALNYESHHFVTRLLSSGLVNAFFFFALGLGALFFLALQYATETGWYASVKRVIESIKVTRNLLSKKNKIDHKKNLISKKVLKIILSYTDKIKRDVWKIED